jgi:hypothetical protein
MMHRDVHKCARGLLAFYLTFGFSITHEFECMVGKEDWCNNESWFNIKLLVDQWSNSNTSRGTETQNIPGCRSHRPIFHTATLLNMFLKRLFVIKWINSLLVIKWINSLIRSSTNIIYSIRVPQPAAPLPVAGPTKTGTTSHVAPTPNKSTPGMRTFQLSRQLWNDGSWIPGYAVLCYTCLLRSHHLRQFRWTI